MLTQCQLSDRSGVPLPTLKDIERGHSQTPRDSTLLLLAGVLQVEPQYLRFGDLPAEPRTRSGGDL